MYLTEYFDPTGDTSGKACKRVLRFGLLGLAQADLKDAQKKLLDPLNRKIADAVTQHEWREITGISSAFAKHGYCAGPQRWITTLRDSFGNQGGQGLGASFAGTLHPNYKGHEQIAQLIKEELELPLKGSCPARISPVAREIAYAPSAGSGDVVPCASPTPLDLPFATTTMLGGLDAPMSILIGLAAVAFAVLALAALLPSGRVGESAPAVLMTVIGAALIDLGFEASGHTGQAVVLSIGGASALIAGPAMLWSIRTPRRCALIEKIDDDTGDEGASAEGGRPRGPRSSRLVRVRRRWLDPVGRVRLGRLSRTPAEDRYTPARAGRSGRARLAAPPIWSSSMSASEPAPAEHARNSVRSQQER